MKTKKWLPTSGRRSRSDRTETGAVSPGLNSVPQEKSADIAELRRLHVEMDQAVAAAYGWTDLDLGHGFHETKQGLRYTISPPARQEVLDRLLELNHARFAEEVKAGLREKKAKASRISPISLKAKPTATGQMDFLLE